MTQSHERRKKDGKARFRTSAAAASTFILAAFVAPGVLGAIRGNSLPVPLIDCSWGTWILFWGGVSVAASGLARLVFYLLERGKTGD